MHASKLLKPLVATVLAVTAFGATASAAHAATDYPPGPNVADYPPGPGAADLPPGPNAADLPPGPGAVGPEI